MTTEICVVHNLWIIQITIIPQTKSPIQNCLRGGFRERVGIILLFQQKRFILSQLDESSNTVILKTLCNRFRLQRKGLL